MDQPTCPDIPFVRFTLLMRLPVDCGLALALGASLATLGCRSETPPQNPHPNDPPQTTEEASFAAPDPVAEGCERVALVQLPSDSAGDFELFGELAATAVANGATMIVFPESSVFGWLNPAVFSQSEPASGSYFEAFEQLASEHGIWIAAGLAEQGAPSTFNPEYTQAYDSGILVDPSGTTRIHHRKYQVLNNAFDPEICETAFGLEGCSYTAGSLNDIAVVPSPLGSRTSLIVCADAYTYETSVLDRLRDLEANAVIVVWGVGAANIADCGQSSANATQYAAEAAQVIETAVVLGANATGNRPYGRFRPAVYCGQSGFALPDGTIGGVANTTDRLVYFDIPVEAPVLAGR